MAGLTLYPDQSLELSGVVFEAATKLFGASVQIIGFVCVVFVVWIALGKYGNIKLGEGKPAYGNASWVFMFICAGLGSATMYWAFMEWVYYYSAPGLGVAPLSKEALEYSIAYSFFHWGITLWAIYGIASLAMAYHFHVRKNTGLSLSAAVEAITGLKATGAVGRFVDVVFLMSTFGGLVLTITLSASTVGKGISMLFGIDDGYELKASLVLAVTLVFSLSSYIGIGKGMQKLAHAAWSLQGRLAYPLFRTPRRCEPWNHPLRARAEHRGFQGWVAHQALWLRSKPVIRLRLLNPPASGHLALCEAIRHRGHC